jgi:hypothetical protein
MIFVVGLKMPLRRLKMILRVLLSTLTYKKSRVSLIMSKQEVKDRVVVVIMGHMEEEMTILEIVITEVRDEKNTQMEVADMTTGIEDICLE